MPEDLGRLCVWSNSPEFMLYVVKDRKTIYADKTLVGAIEYATLVFSADKETIVFFAASEGVAAGLVAPLTAGLICSAETAPQISNNARPNASLRMNCGPASPNQPYIGGFREVAGCDVTT